MFVAHQLGVLVGVGKEGGVRVAAVVASVLLHTRQTAASGKMAAGKMAAAAPSAVLQASGLW